MRAWSVLLGLGALAACTNGPGRDPVVRDAAVPTDAAPLDLGFRDAGEPRDTGPSDVPIGVNDSGMLPEYPFTGVYGILNSPNPLYAREVDGRIHIVIQTFPYGYEGTISPTGEVLARSTELEAGGCLLARLSGTYDRVNAIFDLLHETCNANNEPLSSMIRGGFLEDFDPARSGVYDLEARVVADFSNCFPQPAPTIPVRWAVSFLSDTQVFLYAVDDLFDNHPAAFGISMADYAFTVTQHLSTSGADPRYASTGRFSRLSLSDPLMLTVRRDVYNPTGNCAFSIEATGARISAP